MRSWTIAFSLGVILCSFVPGLPVRAYCLLALGLSLLLHIVRALRPFAAFGLGCSSMLLYGWHSVNELLPAELENQDIRVQGIVWSLPQQTERSVRFEFMVEKLCPPVAIEQCDFTSLQKHAQKVLVNDYQNSEFVPGQQWQLLLRLRRPHGFANPGGFDYEAWLMQQQVRATGYIRADENNLLLADDSGMRTFNRWRFVLARKLAQISDGRITHENLVRALTIGDGYGISQTEWELFSSTGTNHLMVISGSHVALIALFIYRLSRLLYTRWHGHLLYFAAPRAAALAALAGAFVYTGLAGFSLPALRALVMVNLHLAGILLCRQTNPLNALCLALALLLAMDPLASQNAGFWLSFGAVAILLFALDRRAGDGPDPQGAQAWWQKWRDMLKIQLLVFSGLLPVMLVYFHQVSLTAPLVNIIAIPFIGLLVVPLSLMAMGLLWILPAFAFGLLFVVDYLLEIYLQCLQVVAERVPVEVLKLPSQSAFAMVIILLLVWLLQFAPKLWHKAVAVVLLPIVLFWPKQKLAAGELKLTVLDVGQGLAVVAATRNHTLLYDAGPAFSSRFDAGSDVVMPFLQYSNIDKPDIVMISHADVDHSGGLPAIVENFPAAQYAGSDVSIFASSLAAVPCRAGTDWDWDAVHFAIIHPDSSAYGRNNGSCVLRITAGSQTILLPGDIERLVEARLVAVEDLRSAILVAPHHGSRTSSSAQFVYEVQPEVVVFSSGYLNRFGHPAPDVVSRYEAASSVALNTAVSGALTFSISSAGTWQFTEHRLVKRRFWSNPQ